MVDTIREKLLNYLKSTGNLDPDGQQNVDFLIQKLVDDFLSKSGIKPNFVTYAPSSRIAFNRQVAELIASSTGAKLIDNAFKSTRIELDDRPIEQKAKDKAIRVLKSKYNIPASAYGGTVEGILKAIRDVAIMAAMLYTREVMFYFKIDKKDLSRLDNMKSSDFNSEMERFQSSNNPEYVKLFDFYNKQLTQNLVDYKKAKQEVENIIAAETEKFKKRQISINKTIERMTSIPMHLRHRYKTVDVGELLVDKGIVVIVDDSVWSGRTADQLSEIARRQGYTPIIFTPLYVGAEQRRTIRGPHERAARIFGSRSLAQPKEPVQQA
jgi:hypothetical protein